VCVCVHYEKQHTHAYTHAYMQKRRMLNTRDYPRACNYLFTLLRNASARR